MLEWPLDSQEICRKILNSESVLKIVLKTKDESRLLPKWVDYHARLVGKENLIIIDNMSNDSDVLQYYKKIEDSVLIFRYSNFCDYVHRVAGDFTDFYSTLQKASSFFCFLDTDERLYLMNGDTICTKREDVDKVLFNNDGIFFPGIWMNNLPGAEDIFRLGSNDIYDGIKWGKPILSCAAKLNYFINHNCQALPDSIAHFSTGLFIGHLNRLFPDQRIRTNVNKLLGLGFAKSENEIMERINDVNHASSNINLYLKEIRNLLNIRESGWESTINPPKDFIKIDDQTGVITFGDINTKSRFDYTINNFQSECNKTFTS